MNWTEKKTLKVITFRKIKVEKPDANFHFLDCLLFFFINKVETFQPTAFYSNVSFNHMNTWLKSIPLSRFQVFRGHELPIKSIHPSLTRTFIASILNKYFYGKVNHVTRDWWTKTKKLLTRDLCRFTGPESGGCLIIFVYNINVNRFRLLWEEGECRKYNFVDIRFLSKYYSWFASLQAIFVMKFEYKEQIIELLELIAFNDSLSLIFHWREWERVYKYNFYKLDKEKS